MIILQHPQFRRQSLNRRRSVDSRSEHVPETSYNLFPRLIFRLTGLTGLLQGGANLFVRLFVRSEEWRRGEDEEREEIEGTGEVAVRFELSGEVGEGVFVLTVCCFVRLLSM